MKGLEPLLAKMRADWAIVTVRRKASGYWTEEEEAEVLEAIKQAIAVGDEGIVSAWAEWLAGLAKETAASAVGINARVRSALKAEQEKKRLQGSQAMDEPIFSTTHQAQIAAYRSAKPRDSQ